MNNKQYEGYYNDKSSKPFSMSELNEAIKSLNMIKNVSNEFKSIMLELFNKSIRDSKVPSAWKLSHITMIPKKQNDRSNPTNYRPISITSNLGKLCEKLLLLRLNEFLKKKKIILKQQSGFRKYRQTTDNIVFLTQKISESLNKRQKVCAIFFDIAKAFYKIWHNGLLYKLVEIGVPLYIVNWLKDFLDERYFIIKVNQSLSVKCRIYTGVAQVAIMSPTLFSIFINDIPVGDKSRHKSCLFADDLCSYFASKSVNEIKKCLNKYLKTIEEWLKTWRLEMSPTKCSYIVFHKGTHNIEDLNLKLFGENITREHETRILGITFDSRLTFKPQIEMVRNKCIQRMNIIKILSNRSWHLTKETLKTIYVAVNN